MASKPSIDVIQGRLLRLAALFLFLIAVALDLSLPMRLPGSTASTRLLPAVAPWLALAIWGAAFSLLHYQSIRRLPRRDPYLLPAAAILSGWGLLTITRLSPGLGLRQAAWLAVSLGVMYFGLRLPDNLRFLRRYKYLWLTTGLLLTALTLVFGTNPLGSGPRLWLGCCGLYFQPSEPLKLLLLVYLASYLADRPFLPVQPASPTRRLLEVLMVPLLAPTLVVISLALLLMLAQRDLGTASIFVFLYAVVIYLASGRKSFLLASLFTLAAAGVSAYRLFDVVRLRIDAWLNPWLDPSGRSYQIVQSLLAVANGGLFGRGPGLGSPSLVPVAHSDFIFAAITEEYGLAGSLALLSLYALLAMRALQVALHASGNYRRLLAAGLGAYFAGQAVLIIGGNIRLLPLTGVTLPFVSYGGSSLLVSFISLLLLLKISSIPSDPFPLPDQLPYTSLAAFLLACLAAAGLVSGWWAVFRADDLLARTDNARRAIADRMVLRGSLLDRYEQPLVISQGVTGDLTRFSLHPPLSPIVGYTHPVYGQSGLEASLDPYLRGTRGNPPLLVAWDRLLTGFPPPGLDVRLSLDLQLQTQADDLLAGQKAALVLLNAENGEILVLSSHPNFDPNRLDADWQALMATRDAPLLNRTTQALYPTGTATGALLLAAAIEAGKLPVLPSDPGICAQTPGRPLTWGTAIASGCSNAVSALSRALGSLPLLDLFDQAGFYLVPAIDLPIITANPPQTGTDPGSILQETSLAPLNLALAGASLSAGGERPQPMLVLDVRIPGQEWQPLSTFPSVQSVISPRAAQEAVSQLADPLHLIWYTLAVTPPAEPAPNQHTWFLGGTSAGWQGSPLALALVIEGRQPALAQAVGTLILQATMQP